MTRKDIFYIAGFALLLIVLLWQKCSGDKDLENLAEQFGRYRDSTVTYRQVDGKEVADAPAAGLTINEYRAADPSGLAAFEKILTKKDELISTLVLQIINERKQAEVPVTRDSSGNITLNYEDSCISLKTVTPKTGNALVDYHIKQQTYKVAAVMRREKWYKPKQPVAVGDVTSGCGKITGQKIVLITPEKKKVYETTFFKAAVLIGTGFILGKL